MSFPTGTEMFQFPAFALKTLCVQVLSVCFGLFMCATAHFARYLSALSAQSSGPRADHVLKQAEGR